MFKVFRSLELTRFRGHLTVVAGGVHDGRQDGPVYAGVQAADGGVGPVRADCGIVMTHRFLLRLGR